MLYLLLALIAALGFSLSDICVKYVIDNGVSNFQYLFWSHGVMYAILFFLLIFVLMYIPMKFLTNKKKLSENITLPKGKKGALVLLSGVLAFSAMVLVIYAFKISKNIAYTVAVISTTSVFTLIFSSILLGHQINFYGTLGILFILIGVFFISKCDNQKIDI